MSTSIVNAASTAALNTGTPPPSTPANPSTNDLANQNVFLQLLVAQLKNQDPQNPADGTQFITQLAQFSELSNTTQMSSDLAAIRQTLAASAAAQTAAQAALAAQQAPANAASPASSMPTAAPGAPNS